MISFMKPVRTRWIPTKCKSANDIQPHPAPAFCSKDFILMIPIKIYSIRSGPFRRARIPFGDSLLAFEGVSNWMMSFEGTPRDFCFSFRGKDARPLA